MKPGRVKKWVWVDWFTHLFEIPRGRGALGKDVVSLNGATRLIQEHEFFDSGYLRAQRHFNRSKPFLYPLETNQIQAGRQFVSPWSSLPRLLVAGPVQGLAIANGGGCQMVPSRSMAQQRTNNCRPTATIAIFRRDFLPPLIR